MGKTIGILSLKGGVGKTSTVIALGGALSQLGKKVLLIDGNLSAPNLGVHLNKIDPKITLHHVLQGKNNIKESIQNKKEFDIIPASLFNKHETNPLKLRDKIKHLKRKYDVVLIDSSPALNNETLAAMLASDEILIVTTPDLPTLSTTIKATQTAKQRGTPISGLILNKVHNKKFEIPLKKVEEISEVPVMAVVPHDLTILEALSKFKSSTIHNPKSKSSQEYMRLASTLVGEKYKPIKLKTFLSWINPPKQEINRTIFYERVFSQ